MPLNFLFNLYINIDLQLTYNKSIKKEIIEYYFVDLLCTKYGSLVTRRKSLSRAFFNPGSGITTCVRILLGLLLYFQHNRITISRY